jgi:hypothetical protein
MNECYIPDQNCEAIIEAVLALEPCPVTGKITRDQIEIAMGEFGNTWPARIRRDAILSGVRETESIHGTDANVHHVNFELAIRDVPRAQR